MKTINPFKKFKVNDIVRHKEYKNIIGAVTEMDGEFLL